MSTFQSPLTLLLLQSSVFPVETSLLATNRLYALFRIDTTWIDESWTQFHIPLWMLAAQDWVCDFI